MLPEWPDSARRTRCQKGKEKKENIDTRITTSATDTDTDTDAFGDVVDDAAFLDVAENQRTLDDLRGEMRGVTAFVGGG